MAVQTIPSFEFTGFYYFEILADLRRYHRINVPEITDESDAEPYEQLRRAWALAHHYMNVRMDLVANESMLDSARLLESVRVQLKLIDFRMAQATPAIAEVILQFSSLFTTSTLIVPKGSQFATESEEDNPQIIYEATRDYTISRTDRLSRVFVNESVAITLSNKNVATYDWAGAFQPAVGDLIFQGGVYAIVEDVTATTLRLNDPTGINNGAATLMTSNFGADKSGEAVADDDSLVFPFGTTEPKTGDILYLIHDSAMWDRVRIAVDQAYRTGIKGVWEYYDGTEVDENPFSVVNLGPNLRFDLTTLLGTEDRSGSIVTITYQQTSVAERVVSKYVGGVNIAESTGLLGQVVPSVLETDYSVGVTWHPLNPTENPSNDSGEFSADGDLVFPLPQTLKKSWASTLINNFEGFALRFRVQELQKAAATFTGTGFNAVGLDTNNYLMNIEIDGYGPVEIDATGNLGVTPGAYTVAGVAATINAALALHDPALASTFTVVSGQLKATAPDASLGKDSMITLLAPSAKDATNELFGLSEAQFPHEFIGVGGVPSIDQLDISVGNQYLLVEAVQGETLAEDPLGSSDGSPNQEFVLTHTPLIDGSVGIEVNEGSGFTAYDEVRDFLSLDGTAKAFTTEIDAEGVATVKFGDGENGKIPPSGVDNIRTTYRVGADRDGNVGAETVVVNLAGIAFVARLFNPRQATGWTPKAGSTPETLERAKIEGPASLRTLGKAITPSDIETLARQFLSPTTGSRPVSRASAVEETFGVKTIELIIVASGGGLLNEAARDEIDEYFNGNKVLKKEGVLVTNHEVTTVNYEQRVIDVTATVEGGNIEAIKNAIQALIHPEAKFDDLTTYRWEFGSEVPRSLIIAAIHEASTAVRKVTLTAPATDVVLGPRELPIVGTMAITVLP